MNETPIPETDAEAETALKRRLLNRIAVAAVVMIGLLGSLAIFDSLFAPPQRPAPRVAAAPPGSETPAPVKEEPAAGAEAKPGEPAGEARAESVLVATADDKAVPEGTASPAAPPLLPLPAEKPLTRPATGRQASVRQTEPMLPAVAQATRPEPARELAQSHAAPKRAPASRPITQTTERRYAIQMGVFSNLANAEDLRAKLELHGIPSSIEARVHVGPFASREEADAARAKLKELGLDGGLLVSMKK